MCLTVLPDCIKLDHLLKTRVTNTQKSLVHAHLRRSINRVGGVAGWDKVSTHMYTDSGASFDRPIM